jgi:hypothetical protein
MKARDIAVASILSVINLPSASADAPRHGVICNPRLADDSKINYGGWGPSNISTTSSATLTCHGGYATTAGTVRVVVADRNPATNVCCQLWMVDNFGSFRQERPQQCTSGTSAASKVITFNQTTGGIAYVECTLPPLTNTGAASHLMSIQVQ